MHPGAADDEAQGHAVGENTAQSAERRRDAKWQHRRGPSAGMAETHRARIDATQGAGDNDTVLHAKRNPSKLRALWMSDGSVRGRQPQVLAARRDWSSWPPVADPTSRLTRERKRDARAAIACRAHCSDGGARAEEVAAA